MGYTVKSLLSEPEFVDMQVLGGGKCVNNLIRNATVIDCPDAFDWLQPGDFVMTSGYILKDNVELQKKIIAKLSDIACAGLAVKSDKYWDSVPQLLVDEANAHNFPLIGIPLHHTLSQISACVFRQIFEHEETMLQKYFKIHRQLITYSLSEQSLDTIVANSVELINNPLIVFDKDWKLLSYAEHKDSTIPLSKIFKLTKNKQILSQNFLDSIPKDINDFKKAIKRIYETELGLFICSILPIRANNTVYGYIVVWESVRKLRSVEYMGLEQAGIIIALERIKTLRIDESRRAMRHDFFSDLIEGRIESQSSIYSLAEIHGMSVNKRYFCAIIKLIPQNSNLDVTTTNKVLRKIRKYSEECFQQSGINISAFTRSTSIILFVPVGENEANSGLEEHFGEIFSNLYSEISENAKGIDVTIGIGGICQKIFDLKKSFVEAQEAMRISGLVSSRDGVNWFEKLMIYNMLGSGIPKEVLADFYISAIGPVIEYDKENNSNLIETLEMFLLENTNISSAAKRLYIHRNTMNYRINKIKALLNTDFTDAEKLLKLQLGIRIMRIISSVHD